jgi:hypothetical protein
MGYENVHLATKQLGRQIKEPIVLSLSPAELNDNVLSLDVGEVAQACSKCRERQYRDNAKKRNEFPPSQLIARAR